MRNRLTAFILLGMVLGIVTGFLANLWVGGDKALAKDVAGYFHLLADIFLHLIK
ncbi:MAG: dicarboxylate/amino acid:cation symporter, partial [Sphingobium sp.]